MCFPFWTSRSESVLIYKQPKNVPQMPLQSSLIMHSFVDLQQTAEPFRSLNYRFEILLSSIYWHLHLNCIAIRDDSLLVRMNVSGKVTRAEKLSFFFLSPNLLLFESVLFILLFRICVTFTAYLKIEVCHIRSGQSEGACYDDITEKNRSRNAKGEANIRRLEIHCSTFEAAGRLIRNNTCKCTQCCIINEKTKENFHEGMT